MLFRSLAQAGELITALDQHGGITVLTCDCNSDPLNSTIRTGDHVPHLAAYHLLTTAGFFTDQWFRLRHAGPGYTSGLSETVDDPTAAGFRHRIDLVLTRLDSPASRGPRRHAAVTAQRGRLTGDRVEDRDPVTGLWPSDHAGVVLRLKLS